MTNSNYFYVLNNLYKQKVFLKSSMIAFSERGVTTIDCDVKPISKFNMGDDFKLPILVSGRLLTAGKYKDASGEFEITNKELKDSVYSWVGIDIYKSHATFESIYRGTDAPISDIVGRITKAVWNQADNAIDYFAEIYDRDIAFKIISGLIKFVSVGFANDTKIDDTGIQTKYNISPKELSLVFNPKDKKASIHAVKVEY